MKPHSLLTRQLFRAILANRAYRIPGCPLRPHAGKQAVPSRSFTASQRRQIFGLSFGGTLSQLSGARPTAANIETAVSKLAKLANARRTRSRLPADEELIDAFRFLFSARAERPKPLTRSEAFLANETFEYLKSGDRVLSERNASSLTSQDLQNVLLALAASTGREVLRSDYQALAAAIFDVLRKHPDLNPLNTSRPSDVEERLRNQFFESYVTVLAKTGSSSEALSMLQNNTGVVRNPSVLLWVTVLKGLIYEKKTTDFWLAFAEMQQRTGPLVQDVHEDLCKILAERDDVNSVIRMFGSGLEDGVASTPACLAAILSFAIRNSKGDLAAEVASQLRARTDLGDNVGTLLVYYATLDPSVKNVSAKVNELAEGETVDVLDMTNFNKLVHFAYSQGDSALAQNYIDLARSYGLRPDASTWLSRLDFELTRGDLHSAAEAFEALSLEDIPKDRSDVPILNRYISTLSCSEQPNYEHLMRVVDSILETGAEVEPETVAALCRVFLRRDELDEASSLLRYRIGTFPIADRARVGAVFESFILDPSVRDQRAWNAYDLLRHALPETPVEHRVAIMQSFFDRSRPDQACLVFGHMRQREDREGRPTPQAYAQCFHGIAKCRDVDGLQMVYNMLKMDLEVEQTTKVHNALMQANTACRLPFNSLIDHFWKVLDSREGPTLSSFALALQACETWVPQGSQEARRIMALMQDWNLNITKEIYDCYVGALAGQSEFENTVELIECMGEDTGLAPDARTIGTFYNAIPFQFRKDVVEEWAKERYPSQWEELMSYGDEIDEEWEIRYFKIDRTVDLDDDLLFENGEYNPQLASRATLAIEEPQLRSQQAQA